MSVHVRYRETKQGRSYYLDIYHKKVRWYEPLDLEFIKGHNRSLKDIEAAAETHRLRRMLELNTGVNTKRPQQVSDIDFFTFFLSRIENYQGKNKNRLRAILAAFKKFYKRPHLPFHSINQLIIKDFRKYLDNNYNGETPHDYFQKFRTVLKEAVQAGYIEQNPADEIKNPNPGANKLNKNVLFDDEINLLANARCGNLEVSRAFLFSCYSGLRLCDIRTLKWSDIDFNSSILTIVQNKTSQQLKVRLSKEALRILGRSFQNTGLVFNLGITDSAINADIKKWCERAGIEKHITYGCSRHSFISRILKQTGNLKAAGKLAGHTTTRHTEKYAHLLDESLWDAVNSLPPLTLDANNLG